MREPIFKELVIEFIASYEFDEDEARRDNTSKSIKYRLGGHWQELSIIELAVHLGLYTKDEVRHRDSRAFLDHCALWKTEQTNLSAIWTKIGLGPFCASNTKVSQLKYPDHRVVHRVLVNTVFQRKASHDKADKIDLWLLEQIVNDDYITNVPFVLEKMFVDARGDRVMRSFHYIKTPSNFIQKLFKLKLPQYRQVYDLTPNSIESISTRYHSIL